MYPSLLFNYEHKELWKGRTAHLFNFDYSELHTCTVTHHHHHHQSRIRKDRWGTTDDFATSLLQFSLFSTAL